MNMKLVPALLFAAALTGCVSTTVHNAPAAPPVSLTKIYFYPQQGQSEAVQDRDRYECYNWSVQQTGFDPGRHAVPRDLRASVVPARSPSPDQQVAGAAVAGAVIGAIAGGPGDRAEGAVIGAIAGAVLGSVAVSAESSDTRRVETPGQRRVSRRYQQEAAEYRRAMSACLEGRGYSVK
jgi:uncharacterized protein YcfJ